MDMSYEPCEFAVLLATSGCLTSEHSPRHWSSCHDDLVAMSPTSGRMMRILIVARVISETQANVVGGTWAHLSGDYGSPCELEVAT